MPILNQRLMMAANLLTSGKAVADIGTDHAFLPIYLIREGIAERVIACDIAEGPLSVAKSNLEKYRLTDKIELRLADGLSGIAPLECDQITICGMGGETIAEIIEAAPWVRSPEVALVLQPMSCDDRLRTDLMQNGFSIEQERAVLSQGRVYTVMRVRYAGKIAPLGEEFPYIGKLLKHPDAAALAFVRRRLCSMQTCMNEIRSVERKQELYARLEKAVAVIKKQLENIL